ncbi:MAG: hypothetical protein IPL43_05235 [Micropruina sp.]|nr:hypothetical protein [Micropruina sp.]
MRRWALLLAVTLLVSGCAGRSPPPPATLSMTAPPWPAPRDAVANLALAGVPESRLDDRSNQHTLTLTVRLDGAPVPLPAWIGVDRLRAVQGPAHTHDDSGVVWLEGRGAEQVTLGQFFTLWGVRFSRRCLGPACAAVRVVADGITVTEPEPLRLASVRVIEISALTR